MPNGDIRSVIMFRYFRVHVLAARQNPWETFWVTMVGFGISIVVGVLLGFLVGSSRLMYAAVYPLLVAFNAVPKAAIVPILVVWFGIGAGPGILTACLISFFPITVNMATGLPRWSPNSKTCCACWAPREWTC